MPGVILDIQTTTRGPVKGLGRIMGRLRKQAFREMAEYWHKNIFPRHFGNGNKTQYGMKQRNRKYLEEIKTREGSGTGKFTYDVLKGQSMFWAKSMFRITGTGSRVTVKATVPAYFTKPFIGSFISPKGKLKTITQQPDKPAEVTRFNDQDRKDINTWCSNRLDQLIAQSNTATP